MSEFFSQSWRLIDQVLDHGQKLCLLWDHAVILSPGLPIITRDLVRHAKPDPDLFVTAAQRLNVPINHCVVVGDSVWDMLAARRAWALGVGLLSGGYGQQELERAGAYRVYQDPADLLRHLDEVGLRLAQ